MNRSLNSRLNRIEIRDDGQAAFGPWFFAWGRDPDEIAAAALAAPETHPPEKVVRVRWTAGTVPPRARLARSADLSGTEIEVAMSQCLGAEAPPAAVGRKASKAQGSRAIERLSDDALLEIVLSHETFRA